MVEWWKGFAEADILDRKKMIEKLPISKDWLSLAKTDKMTDEQKKFALNTMLLGLFEDSVETMYELYNK